MKKYIIILVLALIAFANAAYLSYESYQFWFSANADALRNMPCDLTAHLSCSGILSNPRALIFGIPFPMIALIVYPIIFWLAFSGYLRKSLTEAKILTGLAFGGMCFNSYVISQEYVISVFCPLCAMCSVIIVSIFILSLCIWKTKKS